MIEALPVRLRRLLPAVLACLLLAGCRRAAPAPAGPRVLRISQRNEPDDLDPALAALPGLADATRKTLQSLQA
ncbi:MAG: hypothetical protein ACREFX_12010, partial [Opitutaceae bacterium]